MNPITGMSNARLATWLFLASEVMLFGALFSVYIVLHKTSEPLPLALGIAATGALTVSAFYFRQWAGAAFLALQVAQGAFLIRAGHGPASHVFYAIFFTLVGVHALHVAAGMILTRFARGYPDCVSLFWNFVVLIWWGLFLTLYLF